ncbi:lysozyme inhibitor LprI family protein [Psychrobacter sp. DAB_AL62B]|uniref:lysozyme inhibitor LprI family protein n=1 Tax=Psychrobacter sp. DAB_AL62B TaxID=1028420 RepID=UPI0023812381|nr:lysozyme inhibitor LprI family protein [Psychrobacter sp. DAB_AL62B]MDE4454625.1 DUF1311 domain-containing protein [Psychrobacter sp. DAB_AL62B]
MNWKNTGITIVTAVFISILSVTSANAELKDYYSECMSKYKTINNSKIYECTGYADQKYKSTMNKAYNKIYKSLKGNGRDSADAESFEKSQLGWLDYRDQQCALEGMYIGSPALPLCVSSKNKERAEELMNFSENF